MLRLPNKHFSRDAGAPLALIFAFLCGGLAQLGAGRTPQQATQGEQRNALALAGYVGSKACAQCHGEIYSSYSQTGMGRSMSEVNASLQSKIPTSASVFNQHLNRHFEIYARQGNLYQSEFELSAEGKENFRDTHRVEWIMGSGVNGFGAIVRRGNYLFEAPLSFYSNIKSWALSPGYEFGDYGFSRPILPGCIACHSGQPQPVLDGNGRFREPPFQELAIGCENCHGPGAGHLIAVRMSASLEAAASSIVNPGKLTPWLADNICMSCHQTGHARVLQPGKQYSDFRPGARLDDTLGIFLIPFERESPPKDDLLEHYLSMRFSKCYRESGGQLSCITCHDPHVRPAREKVSAYFREKCLSCHTEKSCTSAAAVRQHTSPPDDCAGCHMPKRDVQVISHSVLTNHRIIARPEEPFPDAAFRMTTPELPDLVHLSAGPGASTPSPLTLLQAYRQVMLSHPEYRARYWALAKQLETTQPENVSVLEALADLALQQKSWEGATAAIRYLQAARNRGSTQPADFELLARLLVATKQQSAAIGILKQGIDLIPYDAELHRSLGRALLSLDKNHEACEVFKNANHIFPQDTDIQNLLKQCEAADRPPAGPPQRE